MGVAQLGWPSSRLIVCLLALLAVGIPTRAAAAQCKKHVETSSPMFGAKWADTFVLYTQDYNWKASGDITKVTLFFGETEGCVKGIKAQYGADPANAQRLGIEPSSLLTHSLQLKEGERVVRAEYKANGRCIEYLSFRTNQGRQLAIGRYDSPTPTTFAAPTQPGSYLGYLNGHTAKPMTNPHVGKLMQLQLVWVSTSCEEAVSGDISSSSSSSDSKGGSAKEQKSKQGMQASLFSIGSSSSGGGHSEEGAEADISSNGSSSGGSQGVGKCKGNQLCSSDGRCVTSSCSMNGLGADVPNMVCSGTTMRLPFLSAGVAVSPCTFLGCRLDVGSCTSTGLMGVGGFCTGRVVATGTAELLHPQGRQWLGYPCVEHRPAPSIIAGVLGNEQQQQQTFASSGLVAKAWKVCDCVRTATMRSSLAILMPNGTITSFRFGRPADSTGRGGSLKGGSPSNKQQQKDTNKQQQAVVAVPLMPVYDMELKDVMTQWLAAKAGNAALPSTSISADLAEDLQELLPGFTTPSLIIANTSAPLMARPEWLAKGALVFVLPNAALPPLRGLLPDLTSLPTLALPPNMTSAQAEAALKVPKAPLQVADLTIASLPSVASKLGLPLFLQLTPSTNTTRLDLKSDIGPHLVPLEHMHIGNAVVQWATAVSRKEPLPKLVLNNKTQLAQLQAKVPGLVTPSIIVPNISHALLYKPTNASLPLFELPGKTTADAVALLPEMTSLPSFLVLKEQEKQALPKLQLTDFIAPNIRAVVEGLGPSMPMLLKQVSNITIPALNMMPIGGLADISMLETLMSGPWGNVLTMLPQLTPGLLGDKAGFDLTALPGIVTAVQQALATTGFKLPYLSLTEDSLQKWGMKKVEGFVTNILARTVAPHDDTLVAESAHQDTDSADSAAGSLGAVVDSSEVEAAAEKQAGVAAALLEALKDQQPQPQAAAAAAAAAAATSAADPAATTAVPAGAAAASGAGSTAADNAAKQQPQQQGQAQTSRDTRASSPQQQAAYATPAPEAAAVKQQDKQSSPNSSSSDEPPAKPAYQPGQVQKAVAASTKAAAAAEAVKGIPVPVQAAEPVRGMYVPMAPAATLTAGHTVGGTPAAKPATQHPAAAGTATGASSPVPAGGAAGATQATPAPAAAPAQAAPVLRPQKAAQQPAAAAPKVAPKPPQEAAEEPQGLPLGYVDEDGAVVVDVAEARRAFMSEEQWAKVTPEQREKLLLLLNV